MKPFGFVTSGSGRLLEQMVVHSPEARAALTVVITDRECGAEKVAERLGVALIRLHSNRNPAMSDEILSVGIQRRISFFVLLFNRLVSGSLLDHYDNRIINLHPTLLPAFPGLSGLRNCLGSGSRFLGSTIHFVDTSADDGPIILQAVTPNDPNQAPEELRLTHFRQMCKACLQVMEWLSTDRLFVSGGRVEVSNATFSDPDFSPALDSTEARTFELSDLARDP